ncbi:hypothetical protein [Modestobacter sp. SSW1-42]|uniref:hypothetical protein n=1 Tax=Modestobacter sp. SSW1-42 TaxID=596372 RepID=UPI00398870FF
MQANLSRLTGRLSPSTLDYLRDQGAAGAGLIATLVEQPDAKLAEFDRLTQRHSKQATDAWGEQLTLAAPVLREVRQKAGQGVVDELATRLVAGTTTVAEIAAQYGIRPRP